MGKSYIGIHSENDLVDSTKFWLVQLRRIYLLYGQRNVWLIQQNILLIQQNCLILLIKSEYLVDSTKQFVFFQQKFV